MDEHTRELPYYMSMTELKDNKTTQHILNICSTCNINATDNKGQTCFLLVLTFYYGRVLPSCNFKYAKFPLHGMKRLSKRFNFCKDEQ